jgi:hypothetical protein
MNRRGFIRSMVSAVATVAIASKFAPKFPKYEYKTHSIGFTISREEIEDVGARYAEMLAKSMMETKEQVAARVFWDNETDFLHVEGISREEMYVEN